MPKFEPLFDEKVFHLAREPRALDDVLEMVESKNDVSSAAKVFGVEQDVVAEKIKSREIVGFGAVVSCMQKPISVGVATLHDISPGVWTVRHVETDRQWRGKGIGRHVVDMLVSSAESAGASKLTIDLSPGSEEFALAVGFKKCPQRDIYIKAQNSTRRTARFVN